MTFIFFLSSLIVLIFIVSFMAGLCKLACVCLPQANDRSSECLVYFPPIGGLQDNFFFYFCSFYFCCLFATS